MSESAGEPRHGPRSRPWNTFFDGAQPGEIRSPARPSGPYGAPMRVRDAAVADAAGIARVHILSREVTMPFLPPRKRSDAEVEAWVREVVLPGSAVWVAESDGEVVG